MTAISHKRLVSELLASRGLCELIYGELDTYQSSRSRSEPRGLVDTPRSLLGEEHAFSPSSQFKRYDGLVITPAPLPDQIQPASLELRVGNEYWETDKLFTGFDREFLDKHSIMHQDNLKDGDNILCRPSYIYVVKSYEKIKLPSNIEGITDTKSTVGRVGCMSLATDKRFSHLRRGFSSNCGYPENVYFTVEPLAFPIILNVGKTKLFQIRLRDSGTSYIDKEELKKIYGTKKGVSLFYDSKKIPLNEDILSDNELNLTLDTKRVFFHKKYAAKPLDLTLQEHYNPEEFFDVIEDHNEIIMEPQTLYLFGTKERVKFGNQYCGFILRDDPYLGIGIRTHLAGFVDPGFNARLTLEYWSERRRVVKDGQYAGKMLIEKVEPEVDILYGSEKLGSSYQNQDAPTLAKIFKKERN